MEGKAIDEGKQIAASQFIKEREFWTKKLSGQLVLSYFPYDYHTLSKGQQELKSENFKISGKVLALIEEITRDSNPKLHILLTAGLTALLYKYTNHEDIIIGTTIDKQENETGFINTVLALRNQTNDHMTFKELILQTRQTIIEGIENQNYPIEALLNQLSVNANKGENGYSLFDTVLILENIHNRNYLEPVKPNTIFSFLRTGECIEGVVEYNSQLYMKSTIERIIKGFLYVLEQVLPNPDQPLSGISLLTTEEEKALLFDFNDTQTDYPGTKTLHELFAEQVGRTPDYVALHGRMTEGKHGIEPDVVHLTYRELDSQSGQLAYVLKEKGVGRDSIVGIMSERSVETVIGILGILKAGGAYLPIDPDYPDQRIRYMLTDSSARFVVTTAGLSEKIEKLSMVNCQLLMVNEIPTNRRRLNNPPKEANSINNYQLTINNSQLNSSNLAYIIYTSGSSGKPKGVMVEHRNLINYIWWAAKTYVKDERVNFPLYTSISFDLTVTSIFTPLVSGRAIIIYDAKEEDNRFLIEKVIEDKSLGVVKLTPSHLQLIKEKKISTGGTIKRFIVGGEDLKTQLAEEMHRNSGGTIEIYNEYGPTEATVGCMIYQFSPGQEKRESVPIGKPIDNIKIYILDKNQVPVPIGVNGELFIAGAGLARGYLNSPELTAERFDHEKKQKLPGKIHMQSCNHAFMHPRSHANMPSSHHPIPPSPHSPIYRTGDLARWLPGRNIQFLGRMDQQVKIRGFRIETGEIENQLLRHGDVKEVVVTCLEHGAGSKYFCAYLVLASEIDTHQVKEYLANVLPEYMIPTFFVPLPEIPLTSNGKVDRKMLPEPGINDKERYVPPTNETEKKLEEIWSEVLKVEKKHIGIEASFFELGGNSLNAASVISRIHKELNARVPVIELFQALTIKKLAHYITALSIDKHTSIKSIECREYYMLSSAQRQIYIKQQLDLNSISYNTPVIFLLEGNPDRDRLAEVFRELIKRHESFRTIFENIDGEPIYRILKPSAVKFNLEYLEAPWEKLERIINDFTRPFNLTRAPLMRLGMIKAGDKRYKLVLDMHHLISDGISAGILAADFMALYAGETLEPLRIQYKDFSQWQQNEKVRRSISGQEEYWLNQFEGGYPVLNLPYDYSRSKVQDFEGHTVHFSINSQESKTLTNLALKEEASLHMLLLAIYNIFLSRITRSDDIVVGVPTVGRRHTDLQRIVGLFANVLTIRNYPSGTKTFYNFLREVKEQTLQALDNQDYPFDYLVEHIAPNRDASRNPVFDVMFQFLDIDAPEIQIAGLKLTAVPHEHRASKLDMFLTAFEQEDSISFTLEYSTTLFKAETIEKLIIKFKEILSCVVENPDRKLSEIIIVKKNEEKKVLSQFNAPLEYE